MSEHTNTTINHRLHLAVLAALPMMAMATFNAQATGCSGSIASPVSAAITVQCNGTGTAGNLNNASTSSYTDTTITSTAGNNTLIQFDGQGRTLINSGDIINERVINGTTGARGRTAVLMGAATLNAGSGTVFTTNLPATGATTVTLNAAPTAAYVGQTVVFGRYNSAEGDFSTGITRIITAVDVNAKTITFSEALPADFAGTANTDPVGYKVVSNYGVSSTVDGEQYHNVIVNSGTISSKITAAEINGNKTGSSGAYAAVSNTGAVKAITMSVEGDYLINNAASGVIKVQHDGIGASYAIEQGGAVESLTVNNSGTISAERTAALTLVDNTATANPTAKAVIGGNTYAKQTVALVNAINTQEEAEEFILNNAQTGIVRATGDHAAAIYMRAGEKEIVNAGLIEHVGAKGFAIGSVSDPGDVRHLNLENTETGVINGDILVTNGNALRWYLLSTEGSALDTRLDINSQYGQSDSDITNAGHINGNLYFSNGTHVLSNAEGGVINGNIDLDQRNTYSASGNGTLAGTKSFSFENAGSYSGNITVRTATGSTVTLKPTITGSGEGSTLSAPSTDISGMGASLKVWDGTASTIATTTTIVPIAAVPVKNGAWFKVADSLYGTDLPTIQDSTLIDWSVAKNSADDLVIGAKVLNAGSIAGITARSSAAINAFMNSDATNLVNKLQHLNSVKDVEKAGQQLRPEANNASTQAAMAAVNQVSSVVGSRQDEVRTASNGQSGVATGEAAEGKGFWMQGFGFAGDQNKRDGIDGYTASTGGVVFGGDTLIGNGDMRLGLALGYASTSVDGEGATTANHTDVDSYQGTLYSSWNTGAWYLDAELGYGKHKYDSKRFVALANATVTGNHDADQYLAKISAGYPLQVGKVVLTPMAALTYIKLDQDGYTEKDSSGSGAGLSISSNKTDSLRSGLGAKLALPLAEGEVKAVLEARAIWNHEFADTKQDVAARFAGGTSFTTNGMKQARDSANLGLGLSMKGNNGQTLSVNYDAEVKSDYIGQTASLKFRYDF